MLRRTSIAVAAVALTGSGLVAPAAAAPPDLPPLIARATSPGRPTAATAWTQSSPPPRRDSIWNGLVIGAALGVLAIVTTAAEAPPSGKVTTVVMLAATGAIVDWRLSVTHGLPTPRPGAPGPRLTLRRTLRF